MRNRCLFLAFAIIAASLLSGCASRPLSPVAGAGVEAEAL
jgi:hypothetical protein